MKTAIYKAAAVFLSVCSVILFATSCTAQTNIVNSDTMSTETELPHENPQATNIEDILSEINPDSYTPSFSFSIGNQKAQLTGKNVLTVSLNDFAEKTGVKWSYNIENNSAVISDENYTLGITIDSTAAKINDESITLSEAPFLQNESVMLPRDAFEAIGYTVTTKSGLVSFSKAFQTARLIVDTDGKLLLGDVDAEITVQNGDFYILQFNSSSETKAAYDKLCEVYGADAVEEDKVISITQNQDSREVSSTSDHISWGADRIGVDDFIAKMTNTEKSRSVTVAVVDTGADYSHTWISDRLFNGKNMLNSSAAPDDDNGHGTHVAGIIVDCTQGLNVNIMPVKVLSSNGNGTNLTVAYGVQWAANNGADVINLSLGGYDYSSSHYLDTAIGNAINSGVTVVAAAGNDGISCDYFCPAHIQNLICVSAVDSTDNIAYFSNYGSSVDISAPGVAITSSVVGGNYSSWNGTSMAAPYVSAAAALIKLVKPSISPADEAAILKNASDDRGNTGWDIYYGQGVLNMSGIDITDTPETTTSTSVIVTTAATVPVTTTTLTTTPPPVTTITTSPPAQTTTITSPPVQTTTAIITTPVPPAITPSPIVTSSGISVSVNSSNYNNVKSCTMTLRTMNSLSEITMLLDGKDFSDMFVKSGDGVYFVDLSNLSSGKHTYEIYCGTSSSTGSFTL